MLYANKEKIQNLIAEQRTSLAEVSYLDLDFVTKVVDNFENPKFSMENVIIMDDYLDDSKYHVATDEDSLQYKERVSVEVGEGCETVTVTNGSDTVEYVKIHGWTHDDPALIYSNTDIDVFFYDSGRNTVENIDNEAGIDAFQDRKGFFLVKSVDYDEAYHKLKAHDLETEQAEQARIEDVCIFSPRDGCIAIKCRIDGRQMLSRPLRDEDALLLRSTGNISLLSDEEKKGYAMKYYAAELLREMGRERGKGVRR